MNSTTKINYKNEIPYITSECLEGFDWINHCFSTRQGGTSSGIFESMNLSFQRGDNPEAVMENYRRMALVMECELNDFVCTKQTHTANVMEATKESAGMGVVRNQNYDDIDGLVTNQPGLCLVTAHADCVPLYFVDANKHCIGLSHAGWRGTVKNIAQNTIDLMNGLYGSNPKDIVAYIGPSICKKCYEVSEDVAIEFRNVYNDKELSDILIDKGNGKYLLDLHMANKVNMINAGMNADRIDITSICTNCNPQLLFSHRASKGQRGGMCAFMMIKNK